MGMNTAAVQRLYVAYFNRPADPVSLSVYEGKLPADRVATQAELLVLAEEFFSPSAEYTTNFEGKSNAQIVDQLYQNIFGRSAEADGLIDWATKLTNGEITVAQLALQLSYSAQGTDATVVDARIEAAVAFTAGLTTAEEITGYSGDAAAAQGRAYLAQISGELPTTVDAITAQKDSAIANVDASIDAAVNAGNAVAGQTFTLTTGVDNFTGGNGADTFNAGNAGNTAANQTFNSTDILDGGDGEDRLNVTVGAATTYQMTNVSNIETVDATFTQAGTLSLLGSSGVTTVNANGSTAAAVFSNIDSTSVALATTSTNQNATFGFAAAAVSGSADSATLTLNGQTAGTNTIAGVETLNIVSSGAANALTALTAAAATTLNISGDQSLDLGAANTVATTVNAADLTAALTLNTDVNGNTTVTGGSANDTITVSNTNNNVDSITGGDGDDTIIFVGGFANTDTVAGGDGRDELRLDDADATNYTTPTTRLVSGIEQLQITGDLAASLTTATIQAGIEEVVFNDGINTGLTLTLDAGTRTVEFESGIGANGETFTISDTGTATDDSLTLQNGGAATDVFTNNDFAINGFENVTIDNSGTGAATTQNIDNFTITADTGGTTSLTVTGSNAMTFEAITAATIDFTGVTAASTGSTIVMGAAAVGVTTITGSEGNDTLVGDASSTIYGKGGIDTITGGTGNDVIEGGAGNDILNSSTGTDSVKGEDGNDVFAFSGDHVSAGDTYDGGDGIDVIAFNADMTDGASTLQSFSNFEVLRLNAGAADTITLSNLLNTQSTITTIQYGDAGGNAMTVNNVGDSVTNIQLGINAVSVTGDTVVMDRLVDATTNSLTVTHDSGGNAATVAGLTLDDEETITITTDSAADDLTITALDSADLATLTLTGAGDIVITGFTAVTDMPTTVDATAMTGASTVPLTSAVAAVTMHGGSGVDTFTGGLLADTINGNAGNDILSGGNGADTIDGGLGSDNITDGAGGDTITTGANADTVNMGTDSVAATSTNFAGATVAVGDTMTFGNGVDVITDFTAGTGGDTLNSTNAGAPTTLVGKIAADITENTTFFASGTWDAASKTFLILADGSGADTMIIENETTNASDSLLTNSTAIILVGVDSDDLVAANVT